MGRIFKIYSLFNGQNFQDIIIGIFQAVCRAVNVLNLSIYIRVFKYPPNVIFLLIQCKYKNTQCANITSSMKLRNAKSVELNFAHPSISAGFHTQPWKRGIPTPLPP